MVDTELIRQILAVAMVFGLLGTTVWLLGRRQGAMQVWLSRRKGTGTQMQVIERLRVTPQHTLVVLRIGPRGLLIAVHPGGLAILLSEPIAELLGEGNAK
jgi:flagellar biogenesis protein FliO